MQRPITKPRKTFGAMTMAAVLAAGSHSVGAASHVDRDSTPSSASTPPTSSALIGNAPTVRGVGKDAVSTQGGRPIKQVIAEARKSDPKGFGERLQTLKWQADRVPHLHGSAAWGSTGMTHAARQG